MSPSNRALTILAPWRRTLTLVLAISALTLLLAISALAVTGAWADASPAVAGPMHGGLDQPV